MDTGRLFTWG